MYQAEIQAKKARMHELVSEVEAMNEEFKAGRIEKRSLLRKVEAAQAEVADLNADIKQLRSEDLVRRKSAFFQDLSNPDIPFDVERGRALGFNVSMGGAATKGVIGQAPPVAFPEDLVRDMHEAMVHHKSFKAQIGTKTAGDPSVIGSGDAIPTFGGFLALPHEPRRVLDFIPSRSIDTPVIEYLQHSSTTGTAGMVAAGGLKPGVTLNVTKELATVRKIAVLATVNDEDLADYSAFGQYVQNELTRLVIDQENTQVLTGDGTGENLTGLLTVSGIQTIDASTAGPSGGVLDGLDAVEEAVTKLRTGPAFAEASAIVVNPSTWSLLRRTKDSQGRYLVQPDPTQGNADTLWGVKVLQTTSMTAGEAFVFDGRMFAQAVLRQGMTVQADFGQTGFEHNQTSFRCEERLAVFCEYPAAGCLVSNITS